MKRFQNYIDGRYMNASSEEFYTVYNPATGEAVFEVPKCSKKDVDLCVESASAAQKKWSRLSPTERGNYLKKMADLLDKYAEELSPILSLEQGKTLKQSLGEISGAAGLMRYHGNRDREIEGEILIGDENPKENIFLFKEPVGVVGCICPWNFPIYVMIRKLAPALLAGCTVICKPSGETPAATLAFAKVVEEANIPAGVVNIISGSGSVIGSALTQNPKVNMITLTGSVETGREVIKASADNICKVSLELGGKAPAIVMEDADLELAANGIVASRLSNAGQVCNCAERLYVHKNVADEFILMIKERMEAATYGDGIANPNHTMGALINKNSIERIQGMVNRAVKAGGKLLTGGFIPEGNGAFYPPTILIDVKQNSEIVQEEVFGPVLPIITFETVNEALALANDCKYGLTSSLYTNNHNTVMVFSNNIESGELFVNRKQGEAYHGYHAGWKQSGIGGDDGKHGFEEFFKTRIVYIDYKTDLY